jgi:hypothetical protein
MTGTTDLSDRVVQRALREKFTTFLAPRLQPFDIEVLLGTIGDDPAELLARLLRGALIDLLVLLDQGSRIEAHGRTDLLPVHATSQGHLVAEAERWLGCWEHLTALPSPRPQHLQLGLPDGLLLGLFRENGGSAERIWRMATDDVIAVTRSILADLTTFATCAPGEVSPPSEALESLSGPLAGYAPDWRGRLWAEDLQRFLGPLVGPDVGGRILSEIGMDEGELLARVLRAATLTLQGMIERRYWLRWEGDEDAVAALEMEARQEGAVALRYVAAWERGAARTPEDIRITPSEQLLIGVLPQRDRDQWRMGTSNVVEVLRFILRGVERRYGPIEELS